ncbi:30S ribosomal protein S16 [Candidatus Protochlamydia naegleriophila]|uniref:Small ribosomal subunit protein bS16 n=1 Tax=Candidatus Protochlamydia naegleriophila TaxID=389348 RepID=A0A0U5JF47_9BACT|nr:30S ribosomal protein S16 [Candidatus Protochlamydia naegleriophila]CUI17007.1 30S ribosomal protein S16 [Candidatus Protochlamydia naegleriophila]
MALKIRLRQQGRTNRAFFRLVVTDSRSPRDGKYVEALGWYNPVEAEDDKKLFFKSDRIKHWLDLGAQLTESAACLIKKTSPEIIRAQTEKKVAARAKAAVKRKEKTQG